MKLKNLLTIIFCTFLWSSQAQEVTPEDSLVIQLFEEIKKETNFCQCGKNHKEEAKKEVDDMFERYGLKPYLFNEKFCRCPCCQEEETQERIEKEKRSTRRVYMI